MQERNYLICSTQRSGSSLLCHLLKQTGVAGRPGEFLPLAKLEAGRRGGQTIAERAREILAEGRSANGVAGTKLHYHQYAQLTAAMLPDAIAFAGYILVERRDTLMQAVSLARAWQTLQFSSKHEKKAEPVYDPALIEHARERIEADQAGWNVVLSGTDMPVASVVYEDLVGEPQAVIDGVIAALALEGTARPVTMDLVSIRQQRDDISEQWARRYCEQGTLALKRPEGWNRA